MVRLAVVSSLIAAAEAAEAGKLAVTWSDCGAKHAKVTDLQPTSVAIGGAATVTGTGTIDEDVTKAKFTATVKAAGATLATCSGDGTADIECKLPLGAGSITVKALTFPIKQGAVTIPVTVKTSSHIPARLAKVDVHVTATDQNGEDTVCLDVSTAPVTFFDGEVAQSTDELDMALNLNMTTADHSACLAAVRKFRPDITLCANTYSSMADKHAAYDSTHGPHAYVKTKGWTGTCKGLSTGQCECPGWGSEQQSKCVTAYHNEGPGSGDAHGHYRILMNSGSKCVACGYSGGTMTHNFCGSDSRLSEDVVV